MGGKHKKTNRTKNNTRPSNSSHSAELLGNTIPTFFGFSSVKNGVPTVADFSMEDKSCSINSDFQVLFKQMNKKDPTTRFKALQLFTEAVNNAETEAVNAILPLWPRMFCMLCTDVDHKVREVSHKAHRAIVSKVKKMIAPYLKELAGPWFISQCDTYAPAASAATLAFEEAFPSSKLNKAITFCQEEILSYIYDNLINHASEILSKPVTTSREDVQAKYERIVIASLQGYSLYLGKLSMEQIKEAKEKNKQLLSHPKFWKYSKNHVPLIRSSFFRTLVSLCQNAKALLAEQSSHVSSAILNGLDDSDDIVLQSVWNAALNVLVIVEDCWSHINVEKQLFEKLCAILKKGERYVYTLCPTILPLLSKLPEKTISDEVVFYKNLFSCLRCSMEVNSFNSSAFEGKIMVNTFFECMKFTIMQNNSKGEFCSSLVAEQLIPALSKILTGNATTSVKIEFLNQTSSLIYYWHANRSTDNSAYEKLIGEFFLSLSDLYARQLESEVTQSSIRKLLSNQMEFVDVLLDPDKFKKKIKGRVKFEEDEGREAMEIQCHVKETHKESGESRWPEELVRFVKKLVAFYFKSAIEKKENAYVSAIVEICRSIGEKIVFEEMLAAANESASFKLFTSYFSKWLMDDEMKCGELIDLSFLLVKYVTRDEKEYILDELCKDWLNDFLQLNTFRALPNYSHDDFISNWAKSEKFTKNLIGFIERFVDGKMEEDAKSMDVIVALLTAKNNGGEFIVGPPKTCLILDSLNQRLELSNLKERAVELCQNLILHVPAELRGQPPFLKMVASLFRLSCYEFGCEKLFENLRVILNADRDSKWNFEITKKITEVIREIIFSDEMEYSLRKIEERVNAYVNLTVDSNFDEDVERGTEIFEEFIKRSEKNDVWIKGVEMMEKCCRVSHEGNGNVDFEYLERENYLNFTSPASSTWEKNPSFDLKSIQKYLKWNIYVGSILNLIFALRSKLRPTSVSSNHFKETVQSVEEVGGHVEKTVELISEKDSNDVLARNDPEKIRNLFEGITDFLISVCFREYFVKYYAGTKYYRELKDLEAKLIATDLLKKLNSSEFKFVYNQCKSRSIWRILEPTFRKMFNENLKDIQMDESSDAAHLIEDCFERFKKIEISTLPMHRGNYLTILCFVDVGLGHRLTEKQWDEIFIYMHNFFEEAANKSQLSESDSLILSAISRLYLKLKNTFSNNHLQPSERRINSETCLAWNELVRNEMYVKIYLIWKKLAEEWSEKMEIPPEWIVVLQNTSDVVLDGLEMRKCETVKENLDLAVECFRLMTSSNAVIQITAFRICVSTIPDLVKLDAEVFRNNMSKMFHNGKEDSSAIKKQSNDEWTIEHFREKIVHHQGIIEILLSDFFVGDYCAIEPFTDSFTYTLSYLLLWCFLLNMCGEAHSSLRVQYGSWLQEPGYASALLESVFKLMPQAVLSGTKNDKESQKHFECESLDFREPITSKLIEEMACYVYRLFLQRLPNYVREWWKEAENKWSIVVDKVTRLYVSPMLILNELKNVQQDRETGFHNVEVKTYPGSREVVASYTIEEVKMDLIMTLPPNYPLETAKIESSNTVMGTSKWRNLLFQICKYLNHQNGTIWDALVIWKNNLDKKFEGVEECYICFSILQGSLFEIPRLCCHTCKKKFHSNCLYKWFSTSNKSTCPICRNLF